MDFERDIHCILGNVESFGVSAKNLQVSLHNSKVLKYTSQQNLFWDWAIWVNFGKFCNFEAKEDGVKRIFLLDMQPAAHC